MALAHCILGKFLGVGCHCFTPPLDVPTFSFWCLHVQRRERPLVAEVGTLRGRKMFFNIQTINSQFYVDLFVCILFKRFYKVIHMFKIYYKLTSLLSYV